MEPKRRNCKFLISIIFVHFVLSVAFGFPQPQQFYRHPGSYQSEVERSDETVEIEIAPYIGSEFIGRGPSKVMLKIPVSAFKSYSRPLSSSRPRTSTPGPDIMFFGDNESDSQSSPVIFDDEPVYPIHSNNDYWGSTTEKVYKWEKKTTTEPSKPKKVSNEMYGERFLAKGIASSECPKDSKYSKLLKRCIPKRKPGGGSSIIG